MTSESETDLTESTDGLPAVPPHPTVRAVEPGATGKVPAAVAEEEEFLDAVGSHIDEDSTAIEHLRDKISEWYDSMDGQSSRPAKADD